MGEYFEKKQISEDVKYGARPFLKCTMEIPLFSDDVSGAAELNLLIEDLIEKCRAGVEAELLPYLAKNFDSLSLYEQKFKFKPYKYSLDFCVLDFKEDVVPIQIRATLSQNGRCIMKNRVPIFWHKVFRCLCEKE